MSITKWCLGFIFSSDLRHVLMLRKGESLHVGLWNGIGGEIEKDELSLEAMVRECSEETDLRIEVSRWKRVGTLVGEARSWEVDVFATSLLPTETGPNVPTSEYLPEFIPLDFPVMVPIGFLPVLKVAPHANILAFAALELLKQPDTPTLIFERESK